jgi:hypothetical protein
VNILPTAPRWGVDPERLIGRAVLLAIHHRK